MQVIATLFTIPSALLTNKSEGVDAIVKVQVDGIG
jgi:hypothetical protein